MLLMMIMMGRRGIMIAVDTATAAAADGDDDL